MKQINVDDLNLSVRQKVQLQHLQKIEREAKARQEALIKIGAVNTPQLIRQYKKQFMKELRDIKVPELQRAVWREVYKVIPKSNRGRKPIDHSSQDTPQEHQPQAA